MSTKRKRNDLSILKQVEVIKYKKANPTAGVRAIARQFGCGKTQIERILAKQQDILQEYSTNKNDDSKRARSSQCKDIDEIAYTWYQMARIKHMPVTGPMIQQKAKQASVVLGASDFKASNGWLARFKKRFNIKSKVISGEAGDVSEETVQSWKERLPTILSGFSPENILNMDETGQFFRALPNRSLTDASKRCTGGKNSKERVTCAFFVNAAGSREKPIVIGKSKNPRCFKGIKDRYRLPCSYFNQHKAWMDFTILDEVLTILNRRLQREQINVILFMDNAPCHPHDMKGKYDHIKIVFFPANCTSRLQPLDLGIIQSFKLNYTKMMLTHVVSKVEECNSASEVCKTLDILQAMRWIAQAWENVSESTIKKCFVAGGFLSDDGSVISFPQEHQEHDPFAGLDSELEQVGALLRDPMCGSDLDSAIEAVQVGSHLQTCIHLNDNWEEEFFSSLSTPMPENSPEDIDIDEDITEVDQAQPIEPRVKSLKEAMSMLEDVTDYLMNESLTSQADSLSKVLSSVESEWLQRKLHSSVQSKVTEYFKK